MVLEKTLESPLDCKEVEEGYTLAQLGHACRITVGASVVAVLSE